MPSMESRICGESVAEISNVPPRKATKHPKLSENRKCVIPASKPNGNGVTASGVTLVTVRSLSLPCISTAWLRSPGPLVDRLNVGDVQERRKVAREMDQLTVLGIAIEW